MNLPWDPEIDTPATIAIIGGGPIGIEAALYARFLGYTVQVFESERVGKLLRRWSHLNLPGTFGQTASSLGLAALQAQGTACDLAPDAPLTYADYIDKYLIPAAKTDLIFDSICLQTRVASISRVGVTGDTHESLEQRSEREFRVMVHSRQRGEYASIVDIVLDCSGLGSHRDGMASGASQACGQAAASETVLTGKCSVQGDQRKAFAGKHTLLIGDGLEACANVAEFVELAAEVPATKLTWIVPKAGIKNGLSVSELQHELPTELGNLVAKASQALQRRELPIVPIGALGIEKIALSGESWQVQVQCGEDDTLDISCDGVIDCSRPRPDWRFADAIDPRPLLDPAAGISADASTTADRAPGISPILTHEPHYYVLGGKTTPSRGQAHAQLTVADGLQQIREAFGFIGGRAELDLYATVKPQS